MKDSKQNRRIESAYEWTEAVLFGMTVVLLAFTFLVKSYTVSGSSMTPTLRPDSRVYAFGAFYTPQSGDIVMVDANNNLGIMLVKRVIAVGGQTVDIDPATGGIFVDGQPFADPIAVSTDNLKGDAVYPVEVPPGCLFLMGDNRGNSLDSRYSDLGLVDARAVFGRALMQKG